MGASAGVNRKEVDSAKLKMGGNRVSVSPPPMTSPMDSAPTTAEYRQQVPQEVSGSVPPPRFEVPNDGEITNAVSTRGMELDGQQVPVHQYPGQRQPMYGAHEVLGSAPPERFEVSNDGQLTNSMSTRGMELDGQQVPVNQYPRQQPPQHEQGPWPYHYPGLHEVNEGQNQWHQRHELGPGR